MILPLLLLATTLRGEGVCPAGWRESRRSESIDEIRIHCRKPLSAQASLAGAVRDPEWIILKPAARKGVRAEPITVRARPDTVADLVALAKQACAAPSSITQEYLDQRYRWFPSGADFSAEAPKNLFGCDFSLLQELIQQNRHPTPGLFSASWLNQRAASLRAPPPPPPARRSGKCEGFYSEIGKWVCVEP